MYTNALHGARGERHVWYVEQQRALARAREQGVEAALASACTREHVYVLNAHTGDSLVPIRDLGVGSLAEFLARGDTCEACAEAVVERTGMDWDDYDGAFTFGETHEALGDPAWVEWAERRRPGEAVAVSKMPPHDLADEVLVERPDGTRVEAVVVEAEHPEVVDDGQETYVLAGTHQDGGGAAHHDEMHEVARQVYLERLTINSYTQPIHFFLDDEGEAYCGITAKQANQQYPAKQANQQYRSASTFPAEENHEDMDALVEALRYDADFCEACTERVMAHLRELEKLEPSALARYATGHSDHVRLEWQGPRDERTASSGSTTDRERPDRP